MLPVAAILVALVGLSSALTPVQPAVPVYPRHTLAEWESILDAQTPRPEVCAGCTPGTVPQPAEAGRPADGSDAAERERGTRIIGGSVASAGQFPWQALVRMDNSFFCGGSVLSDQWVLSAGHCARGFRLFQIVLGSLYSSGRDEPHRLTFTSRTAIPHPTFNLDSIRDDISLIKLPARILRWTTHIRPVLLPPRGLLGADLTGQPAVVSGFGRFGTTSVSPSISPVLRYANVSIVSNYECAQAFGEYVLSSNICTSGVSSGPTGSCNGDSGGPLILAVAGKYVEVGIVSFGSGLGCNLGFPSAFTRVTSYLDWISNNTGIAISS